VTNTEADKITMTVNGDSVPVPLENVAAVYFAAPGQTKATGERGFRIRLSDGSSFVAAGVKLTDTRLALTMADKSTRELDLAGVTLDEQVNGPLVWLSSLKPVDDKQVSQFDLSWPTRMDRSVTGNRIRYDRLYDRGIGVHAKSTLTFALDAGKFQAFRTQYGIDGSADLADVTVHAILLTEEAPPPGHEALTWLLYTSLPIDTAAALQQALAYYLARWEIELFFKVLKSGCTVERLYLQTADRLMKALACYWLIAWRILYCTRLGQACPDLPCTVVFTPVEWQAVYLIYYDALPATPPTLQAMLHLVARGGGFIGRAGDGQPGIQAVWLGLQRAHDYALAYQRFGPGRRTRPPSAQ
jgi:hypothetical protein